MLGELDKLTTNEQITILRIAVRTLELFGEHSVASEVERIAGAIDDAETDGRAYRPE